MSDQVFGKQGSAWPKSPYKGLSYYGPADRPLYAGRDDDIRRCSALLMLAETRTLLLHGKTACGKSSFLQAGLIPTIESEGFGYEFLKDSSKPDLRALFIRCTKAPLKQLADRVFEFANSDYELHSPLGRRTLNLRETLGGVSTLHEFRDRVNNEDFLVHTLQEISSRLPKTLIVVLDQAEEVLTLNPSDDQGGDREKFFSFLQAFNSMSMDFKLVIALRTEYYGRFFSAMNIDSNVRTDAKEYLLDDLNETMLRDAIERPTLQHEVPPWGVPFDVYRFEFEPGLPQRIAHDLLAAKQAGGVLPLMQIVCRSLYDEIASKGTDRIITGPQYEKHGGVEGRIDEHIQRSLREAFRLGNLPAREVAREEERWRLVLCKLATVQEDGTVTTNVLPATVIENETKEERTQVSPDTVLDFLASPEILLVRKFSLLNVTTARSVDSFSLGHDVIGLALNRWKTTYEEHQKNKSQMRMLKRYTAAVALVLAVAALFYYLAQQSQRKAIVRNDAERIARQAKSQAKTNYQLGLLLALAANRTLVDAHLEDTTPLPKKTLLETLLVTPDFIGRVDGDVQDSAVSGQRLCLIVVKYSSSQTPSGWQLDLEATEPQLVEAAKELSGQKMSCYSSEDGRRFLFGTRQTVQVTSQGQVVTYSLAELLKTRGGRLAYSQGFGREMIVQYSRGETAGFTIRPLVRRETKEVSFDLGQPRAVQRFEFGNRFAFLAYKSEGRKFDLRLWDIRRWNEMEISIPSNEEQSDKSEGFPFFSPLLISFAPDDSSVAFLNRAGPEGSPVTIAIPDWSSKRVTTDLHRTSQPLRAIAVGPVMNGSAPLVVMTQDGSIQLELPQKQELAGVGRVMRLRFTDQAKRLIAFGSGDETNIGPAESTTILSWSMDFDEKRRRMQRMKIDELMDRACQLAARPFTTPELLQYFGSTEFKDLCAKQLRSSSGNR